ncbi:MAG TPA: FMN-binding glutamate synthase family protein [Patescibacteria group bacterium]|nr:FMN-binding glutamate synthase family protein [Patescibacteria group bacterium]
MFETIATALPTLTEIANFIVVAASTVVLVGTGTAAAVVGKMIYNDRKQTKDAVRHNVPLLGRLIPFIDRELGPLLRNHIIAPSNNQQPFDRNARDHDAQASQGKLPMTGHGSNVNIHEAGVPLFVNAQYGLLPSEQAPTPLLTIGEGARNPYTPKSIFNISAMSHGSLGKNAVTAISKGAALANCWVDIGEGGMSPYHLEGHCDLIFQIGTAKYGVRKKDGTLDEDALREAAAHPEVKMFEIKLNQGAKPGKGGILPGAKVTPEIAGIRHLPVFQDSISPNRHVDIKNDAELLDQIHRVREITGKPTGIKTIFSSRKHVESLCDEILKRGIDSAPDFITLDGGEGGSGAAPTGLMDSMGISIIEEIPMVKEVLVEKGLDKRIRIIAAGKMGSGKMAALAIALGADFVNAARGVKRAMGCVGSQNCHLGTCVAGITTHDPELQKALDPEVRKFDIANFMKTVTEELEIHAHSVGVPHARLLRPEHVRFADANGVTSTPATTMFPNLKF